ncbi:MAG: CHASE domain-containing protein, partial [Bdellovibrionota bacterium]
MRLSKSFIFKFSAITISIIFVTLSVIVTKYVQESYENTENDLIQKETEFVSFELAENLRRNIAYRVKILEIIAHARPDIFPNNQEQFLKIIPAVSNNLPGFYAINWVNTEGTIKWIYPSKGNKSAIGKNILHRTEVTQYLLDAKKSKLPTISHVIDLYQGPKGLILYIPIYDKEIFKGWYNGVISINEMLDRFFERRKLHNISVTVKWKGHENYVYTYGAESSGKAELEFESDVLNQKLLVAVDLKRGSAIEARKARLNKIFTVVYIFIALIALF